MLAVKNEGIKKAVAKLAELSQDEKTRLQYEYEEKKRRDFVSRIEGAKMEGRKNALLDTARLMKNSGLDINRISYFTGLNENELNNL